MPDSIKGPVDPNLIMRPPEDEPEDDYPELPDQGPYNSIKGPVDPNLIMRPPEDEPEDPS